jgi:hypothetical protein
MNIHPPLHAVIFVAEAWYNFSILLYDPTTMST